MPDRLCTKCRWSTGTTTLKCVAPQNQKGVDPVDGTVHRITDYCSLQREGKDKPRLFRAPKPATTYEGFPLCGQVGHWFTPKE